MDETKVEQHFRLLGREPPKALPLPVACNKCEKKVGEFCTDRDGKHNCPFTRGVENV